MQSRLTMAVVAALVCASSTVLANCENYLGVSYKYRSMHGHNTDTYDTRPVLPKGYNGGEVYFVHRFENDVGVYVGYEQSAKTPHSHVFSADQEFLGPPQLAGTVSETDTSIKAVQFDMVGYVDFLKYFEAVGQFGFSLMHADMSGTITSAGVTTNMAPGKTIKFIPRLSLGIQYFLLRSCFGIRVMGDWEATNLYRLNMTDDDGIRYTIRPFKQSWCATVGLFVRF